MDPKDPIRTEAPPTGGEHVSEDPALVSTKPAKDELTLPLPAGIELPLVERGWYEVEGELARGGLGRILTATDRRLGRPVALKELLRDRGRARERFLREALITARLQHPSIVPIYEAGRWPSGEPFYAMKMVAGRPFDKVIAEAKTLAARIALLPVMIQTSEAIAYAHSKKIIHRDLKPANVLVGEFGETIVIDWGLAKELGAAEERETSEESPSAPHAPNLPALTSAGAIMGTPAYMPPEQAYGQPVDTRADVYSLGAMLYHLLSGKMPYSGRSTEEILSRLAFGPPPPIEGIQPSLPKDLLSIVHRAMAREPKDRYENAGALLKDLKEFQSGQLVAAHQYSTWERIGKWVERHRAAVWVGVTSAVLLLLVGGVGLWWILSESARADRERDQALIDRTLAKDAQRDAEQEKKNAERTLSKLLEEQGRQELLSGTPARGIAFLNEAYQHAQASGAVDDSLRILMAEAIRPLDAQQLSLGGHSRPLSVVRLSKDGKRLLTASHDRTAKIWELPTGKLLHTLEGHTEQLTTIELSPDEDRLVTASTDHTAKIWELSTGRLLVTIKDPTSGFAFGFQAKFSPDGKQIVTSGGDMSARLWDASSGALLFSFQHGIVPEEDPLLALTDVAFSPDGKWLVTAGDKTPKLWDLSSGKLRTSLEDPAPEPGDTYEALFSPDGTMLITAGSGRTGKLWEVSSGRLLAYVTGASGALTVSPDGKWLAASSDKTIKLWDLSSAFWETPSERWLPPNELSLPSDIYSMSFSPDSTQLATVGADTIARLWDISSGVQSALFEGHRGAIFSLDFSSDGEWLATGSEDKTAKLWKIKPSKLSTILGGHPGYVLSANFSPDGRQLITSSDKVAKLWEVSTGKLLFTFEGHKAQLWAADFSSDGRQVVTAGIDRTAKLWNASTGKLLFTLEGHSESIQAASFSPDGKKLATASADNTAKIWETSTGKLLFTLNGNTGEEEQTFMRGTYLYAVRFSPDGSKLVTANDRGVLKLWDVASGALLSTLRGHKGYVRWMVFLRGGERLITASQDGTAILWEPLSGKVLLPFSGGTEPMTSLSLSQDEQRLATTNGKSAKVWEVSTGKPLASLDGHTKGVQSVRFSPDGSLILTASTDGTARLWSTASGRQLISIEGHRGGLLGAEFSPDGTMIATSSIDKTAKVWCLSKEIRSPGEIDALVRLRSPWRLEGGVLVPVVSKEDELVPKK